MAGINNTIIEFVEVSIHQLLYVYEVYPTDIFIRKQKYGVPVQVSGHPLVNSYINQCLQSALELLKQRALVSVMLVFCLNDQQPPVKKIIFDTSALQLGEPNVASQDLSKLELSLRDMFLRLSLSDRHLRPLPKGCTFKILLGSQEHGYHTALNDLATFGNEEFPWIQSTVPQEPQSTHMVPLSSLDVCGVKIQVYAEENDVTSLETIPPSQSQ